MKPRIFLAAVIAAIPQASPAQYTDPVAATYACLAQPIENNDAFPTCLAPMESAFTAAFDDIDHLQALVLQSEPLTQQVVIAVSGNLSPVDNETRHNNLNTRGFAFQDSCIQYQNEQNISDNLIIWRCEADINLFILHFHFDNYFDQWG